MYLEITNSSKLNIQGLDCIIPPEGYVVEIKTGNLIFTGIHKRSEIQSEQYWERTPLPDWYKSKMREEDAHNKKRKRDDPPYFDAQLEEYTKQEWFRRLNGFWFMNNGKSVYLTGSHYVYLQWWQIDIGYPKWRVTDLEYFYFLQYCIEDPECMGMLEITKRRFGKTFRGGLFLYEYITRTREANGGIQSKTGADAKKMFGKAVVKPFKKLPRFFRPEYDMSLGITPKTEIRFQQTNVRGKEAEELLDREELGSLIDFQSADILAYDGQKLQRTFQDEWAKTIEVNIYDRHEVIRYCLLDDENKIIGKALYSSTVEKLETERDGVQESAIKLWNDSDQLNKGEDGRTASGLYRFFMTADRSRNFDLYGYPDIEKTIRSIMMDRDKVKHNLRSLTKRIKKEARTIEEAFLDDADECIFNINNINEQKAYLREHPVHKRTVQYYRDLDQVVKWKDVDPDKTDLYWKHISLPKPDEINKIDHDGQLKKPGRSGIGVIGVDGYSNTQGGKKYGSKLSGWMFLKYDILDPENTGLFVGHIYGRPNDKDDMYNQILLAAEYWGFPVYFEFVADDYYTYFKNRGRLGYLPFFPMNTIAPEKRKKENLERQRGFPTTEFALTKQNDAMITYVDFHYTKIFYEELLEDLPKFRPYKRTPSDITVSAMITLVSSMDLRPKAPPRKKPLVTVYENQTYGREEVEA
jgi:hypothetical protein